VALKEDGTVACWGAGTTNTGSSPNWGQSIVPSGLGSVTAVAAGESHTVALKQDGTVACWGNNAYGQRTVPTGLGSVTAVTAGSSFTIALVSPPTASLSSSTSATCSLANGAIAVDVWGATSLAWSGPNGFSSTSEDLSGLAGGTYTLTATGYGGTATLVVVVATTADTTAPAAPARARPRNSSGICTDRTTSDNRLRTCDTSTMGEDAGSHDIVTAALGLLTATRADRGSRTRRSATTRSSRSPRAFRSWSAAVAA
jgi:hypothetical protein